jgi:hypothetical protein
MSLYPITTRAAGTLISALIYNSDHQVHVDARNAAIMGSYCSAASQMQDTEDPYPGGLESLPSTLAGEIARLRFMVAAMKTSLSGDVATNWFTGLTAPGFATLGAQVLGGSGNSIPTGVATVIDFSGGTALYNNGTTWDPLAPTRFTAPVTGKYYVAVSVQWTAAPGGGQRELRISKNGSTTGLPRRSNTTIITSVSQAQNLATILQLTAGDYIEFVAFQNSGSNITIPANATSSIVANTVLSPLGAIALLGS